ncbi:hypothetical protein OsJ_28419 [Oryza sativa Japonica Group]|uniref:Uncharacterized protein n=1 Tax=Oryza sativa subsp. japonica TaxID=39947 RepID=A3BW60_ORYSJ|nr:hypothetical protein OsJ_28419 [Oryza sativa Japonica Group]
MGQTEPCRGSFIEPRSRPSNAPPPRPQAPLGFYCSEIPSRGGSTVSLPGDLSLKGRGGRRPAKPGPRTPHDPPAGPEGLTLGPTLSPPWLRPSRSEAEGDARRAPEIDLGGGPEIEVEEERGPEAEVEAEPEREPKAETESARGPEVEGAESTHTPLHLGRPRIRTRRRGSERSPQSRGRTS